MVYLYMHFFLVHRATIKFATFAMDTVFEVLCWFIFFLSTIVVSYNLFQPRVVKNLPPGPRPWPLLGNLVTIFGSKTPPHITFANLARAHGGLMLLWFGHKPVVFVSDKEVAMEVLKTHDRALSGRHVPASFRIPQKIQHSLVWSDCTDYWKLVRRTLRTEVFSPKMLRIQEQVREKKVGELMEFMRSKEGQVVTIRPVVFGTILNILGNAIFSRDMYDLGGGKGDMVGLELLIRELLVIGATPDLADYYSFLKWLDPQGLKKQALERLVKVDKLWESTVKDRRQQKKSGSSTGAQECKDMLDVLIANNFTDLQIDAIFLETFGPGSESSSATVEWVMSELIKHPDAMAKVRQELDEEYLKQSKVTGPRLTYLNAVIKETMRLHPAIPFMLPHRAVETSQVLGYTIPKGFQVQLNAYAIGRDPKAWKDPNTFRPERFLESDIDYLGNHFELIPFGAGRRICPGLPLAVKNTPLIVSSLVRGFDWSLPDGLTHEQLHMNETVSIALIKDPSLRLIPKVRVDPRLN